MSWLKPDYRANTVRLTSRALTFRPGNKGLATIEFAMTGSLFLFAMLFVMDLGLQQFAQAALDAATQAAARQIQIATSTYRGSDPAALKTLVCTRLSVLAPSCKDASPGALNLTVYAVSGLQFGGTLMTPKSPPFKDSFTPGGSRDYVLLQVAFKRPQLIPLGGFAQPYLVSSVIFENEP